MTALGAQPVTRSRARTVTLWTGQVLVGLFLVIASALPKLFGQQDAVEGFNDIGAGQWFRYFVGAVELAGGIGLLIPRLAGLAAVGLVGLMIGATFTQLVVLDQPVLALTPVAFGVVCALIAWARWPETKALLGR